MRRWMPQSNERGVTMVELLVTLALMGVVFGGVVAFSTSTMSNFFMTSKGSWNQQEATMIINQVTQDLRRLDPTSPWVAPVDGKLHLRTARANDPQQNLIDVLYTQDGTKVLYTAGDNLTVTLTENGVLEVQPTDDDQDVFQINVTVGDEPNQAKLTTTVARYNWGP